MSTYAESFTQLFFYILEKEIFLSVGLNPESIFVNIYFNGFCSFFVIFRELCIF